MVNRGLLSLEILSVLTIIMFISVYSYLGYSDYRQQTEWDAEVRRIHALNDAAIKQVKETYNTNCDQSGTAGMSASTPLPRYSLKKIQLDKDALFLTQTENKDTLMVVCDANNSHQYLFVISGIKKPYSEKKGLYLAKVIKATTAYVRNSNIISSAKGEWEIISDKYGIPVNHGELVIWSEIPSDKPYSINDIHISSPDDNTVDTQDGKKGISLTQTGMKILKEGVNIDVIHYKGVPNGCSIDFDNLTYKCPSAVNPGKYAVFNFVSSITEKVNYNYILPGDPVKSREWEGEIIATKNELTCGTKGQHSAATCPAEYLLMSGGYRQLKRSNNMDSESLDIVESYPDMKKNSWTFSVKYADKSEKENICLEVYAICIRNATEK